MPEFLESEGENLGKEEVLHLLMNTTQLLHSPVNAIQLQHSPVNATQLLHSSVNATQFLHSPVNIYLGNSKVHNKNNRFEAKDTEQKSQLLSTARERKLEVYMDCHKNKSEHCRRHRGVCPQCFSQKVQYITIN
jgi:hypothetical protein